MWVAARSSELEGDHAPGPRERARTAGAEVARLDEAWAADCRQVLGSIGSLDRLDAEALHRLRRDCRRLRFVSEIRDLARGSASPLPGLLQRAQVALGAIHDDGIAQQWLEGRARVARTRGRWALARAALELAERFRQDGQARHRALAGSGLRERLSACLEGLGQGGTLAGQAWLDASGS